MGGILRLAAAGVLGWCSGAYADIVWQTPQMLSDPNTSKTDTSNAMVGMDAAGNAAVLYRNYEANNNRYFYQGSFCPPEGPCGPVQAVSQANARDGVMSNMCAVWDRFNTSLPNPDWQEEISCYTNGMWAFPVTFQDSLTKNPLTSGLAVNQAGYGVAIWPSDNGTVSTYTSLQASILPGIGINPEPFQEISLPNLSADSPCATMDAAGNAMVIFVSKSNTPGTWVMATNCPYGGSWSTPEKISPTSFVNNVGSPVMDVDANGNIIALWLDANNNVGMSLFTWDGGWGSPVTITSPFSGSVDPNVIPSVSVRVTPTGTPFATAVIGCPDGTVWAVDIASNGTAGAAQQLSEDGELATFPKIVIDPVSGNYLVGWREYNPISLSYASIIERIGGVWRSTKKAAEGMNLADIDLALQNGSAVIVYDAIPDDAPTGNSACFVIQGTASPEDLREKEATPKKSSWWPWGS